MSISEDDIEFSFFKSSGPGGQKKNVTESSVRARHIPTGITVVATQSRSQRRNKELAIEELERRIAERNKPRKPRKKTRPTRSSKERRVTEKKQQGQKKAMRKPPKTDY